MYHQQQNIPYGQGHQSHQGGARGEEPTNGWQSSWGYAPTMVFKWCTNDCQPTMETYLKIADLLDVELTELVRTKKSQMEQPSF